MVQTEWKGLLTRMNQDIQVLHYMEWRGANLLMHLYSNLLEDFDFFLIPFIEKFNNLHSRKKLSHRSVKLTPKNLRFSTVKSLFFAHKVFSNS